MRTSGWALALTAVALAAAVALPQIGARTTPSELAPEITAGEWFHADGGTPSLASLRGRAVLIEFWATW